MDVDVRQVLLDVIAEILPDLNPQEVTDDRSLRDLGADSVDRVEIIALLTDQLGLSVPLSAFAAVPDIGALIKFLDEV